MSLSVETAPSNMEVHFSSKSVEWGTPWDFFNELNAEFNFNTDVCATLSNHKCNEYFTPEIDGLAQPWRGICWMNPPYGREISKWIKKAYESAQSGHATVVCLIPSRTDTKWWHEYVIRASEVRFIRGRLKFINSADPSAKTEAAPFPCAVVIFKRRSA